VFLHSISLKKMMNVFKHLTRENNHEKNSLAIFLFAS